MNFKIIFCIGIGIVISFFCKAQEQLAPLDHNILSHQKEYKSKSANKTTALTLPFFEDFTGYDIFPDAAKWVDHSVYVNNTMAVGAISRGVATFDALNAKGGPYDSVNNNALVYADSLTSLAFDLTIFGPSDSLYVSFFYQPQGNGFSPEVQDSLMFYLKKPNDVWTQVWAKEGITLQPFLQVMIPVNDTAYFHNDFQFRFVNKASINLNDDVWNVDYIRFSANRNINDTAVNDVATTIQPSNILNDYTSMPYRHFAVAMNAELATQDSFTVKNNYSNQRSIVYGYNAKEITTNTNIFTSNQTNANLSSYSEQSFQFPMYGVSFAAPDIYSRIVFENKYYATQSAGSDPKENDTILHQQVFDNYFAYDDGSAEKSYFLKQFSTLPAILAIEFHLNQPDTIRGVAIYFGRQVPLASNKFFSILVYKDIAVNGGADDMVYQQDLLFPGYVDTVNRFWNYKFDSPVALNAGTFFLGSFQPASSGSDSLYYGYDENRTGCNHAYINVLNSWGPSIFSGAIMIRPLLGQAIIGTNAGEINNDKTIDWSVFPNPATDHINIEFKKETQRFSYEIIDVQGRVLLKNKISASGNIDISNLQTGIYFIRIFDGQKWSVPKKIIKI